MSGTIGDEGKQITIRRLSSRPTREVKVDQTAPRRRIELGPVPTPHKIRIARRVRLPKRISAERLLQPIVIHMPVDGQVFQVSEVKVVGQANPGTHLVLVNGRYRAETRSSSGGKFTFSDVRLSIGPNTIMVLDLDHLTWEQARASIRVVRQEQLAPFGGHKDPLTNAPLVEGEPVVRCSICWTYCYLSSWRANGNCSICCMRGLTPRYWTSDDDEFYMTREELNRR